MKRSRRRRELDGMRAKTTTRSPRRPRPSIGRKHRQYAACVGRDAPPCWTRPSGRTQKMLTRWRTKKSFNPPIAREEGRIAGAALFDGDAAPARRLDQSREAHLPEAPPGSQSCSTRTASSTLARPRGDRGPHGSPPPRRGAGRREPRAPKRRRCDRGPRRSDAPSPVDEEHAPPALHDDGVTLAHVEQCGRLGAARSSRFGSGETPLCPETRMRRSDRSLPARSRRATARATPLRRPDDRHWRRRRAGSWPLPARAGASCLDSSRLIRPNRENAA